MATSTPETTTSNIRMGNGSIGVPLDAAKRKMGSVNRDMIQSIAYQSE